MDLMLGGQLGHGFLFFQYFENDPDLQFDGITHSKSAHNVLIFPTFPWGKRYAMISFIDNSHEGGEGDERHGAVPEFFGDCIPLER